MKPVCVPCKRFYRPKKNGFEFIEGMPVVNGARPGLAEPDSWQPYKVWMGDLWECPDCCATIIVGTGFKPIAERHHDHFSTDIARLGETPLQVNDC